MKKTYLLFIVLVMVFAGLLLLMRRKETKTNIRLFLKTRDDVLRLLSSNFNASPEGTTFARKPVGLDNLLFPGSDHIRAVARRQQYHGTSNLTAVLELSDTFISTTDQGSSEPCAARKLLDFFSQGIGKTGLQSQGSPGCGGVGYVQYVQQSWHWQNFTIYIIAEVVVDLKGKTAFISFNIIESL